MAFSQPSNFQAADFVQEDFYQLHSFPAAISTLPRTALSHAALLNTHLNPSHDLHSEATPRSIGLPYAQQTSQREYFDGSPCTAYSDSSSARGRSGSNGSTVCSENYALSSSTSPTVAFAAHGTDSQCRATYCNRSVSLEQISPQNHVHGGAISKQPGSGVSASSGKTPTKEDLFCPHEDCRGEDGKPTRTFSRKADITRHYKSAHEPTYLDCPRKNCARKITNGFTRKDHLVEHLRGFHMETIEKRTPGNKKKQDEKKGAFHGRVIKRTRKPVTSSNACREPSSPHNPHEVARQESDFQVGDGANDENHEFHQDTGGNPRVKIPSEYTHWIADPYYVREQDHYPGQARQQTQIKQLPGQANSEATASSPVYAIPPGSQSQIYGNSPVSPTYDNYSHRQMTRFLSSSANGFHYPTMP